MNSGFTDEVWDFDRNYSESARNEVDNPDRPKEIEHKRWGKLIHTVEHDCSVMAVALSSVVTDKERENTADRKNEKGFDAWVTHREMGKEVNVCY